MSEEDFSSSPSTFIGTPDSDWVFADPADDLFILQQNALGTSDFTPANIKSNAHTTYPPALRREPPLRARQPMGADSVKELGSLFQNTYRKLMAMRASNEVSSSIDAQHTTDTQQVSDDDFFLGSPTSTSDLDFENPLLTTTAAETTDILPASTITPLMESGMASSSDTAVEHDLINIASGIGEKHQCCRPDYGRDSSRVHSRFGCGETVIRVASAKDMAMHTDFGLCGTLMELAIPDWTRVGAIRKYFPSQPPTISISEDFGTVYEAASIVFRIIHENAYPDVSKPMDVLACVVEISSLLGGCCLVDNFVLKQLPPLVRSSPTLEDVLNSLFIVNRIKKDDLFHKYAKYLVLNFMQDEVTDHIATKSAMAPYMKASLAPALYSIDLARFDLIKTVTVLIYRVVNRCAEHPSNSCWNKAGKYLDSRFLSGSVEVTDFDLHDLVLWMESTQCPYDNPTCACHDEYCYYLSKDYSQLLSALYDAITNFGTAVLFP